jgi:hypothetical protein
MAWGLVKHRDNFLRGYVQKFQDWVDNEKNNNNKHSLENDTKGYGGKTH